MPFRLFISSDQTRQNIWKSSDSDDVQDCTVTNIQNDDCKTDAVSWLIFDETAPNLVNVTISLENYVVSSQNRKWTRSRRRLPCYFLIIRPDFTTIGKVVMTLDAEHNSCMRSIAIGLSINIYFVHLVHMPRANIVSINIQNVDQMRK